MQRTTTDYVISKRHMLVLEERGKGQILPNYLLLTFYQPHIPHQICELLLCLMASLGEEARRRGILDSSNVNQVKGKQADLFVYQWGEHYIPP